MDCELATCTPPTVVPMMRPIVMVHGGTVIVVWGIPIADASTSSSNTRFHFHSAFCLRTAIAPFTISSVAPEIRLTCCITFILTVFVITGDGWIWWAIFPVRVMVILVRVSFWFSAPKVVLSMPRTLITTLLAIRCVFNFLYSIWRRAIAPLTRIVMTGSAPPIFGEDAFSNAILSLRCQPLRCTVTPKLIGCTCSTPSILFTLTFAGGNTSNIVTGPLSTLHHISIDHLPHVAPVLLPSIAFVCAQFSTVCP